MKIKIIFVVLVFFVGCALSSCNDEVVGHDIEPTTNASDALGTFVPVSEDSLARSLSKVGLIREYGEVYICNSNGRFRDAERYRTIRIRNVSGTFSQEWLLEDVHSDFWYGYDCYPGDNGTEHGYYYHWGHSSLGQDIFQACDFVMRDSQNNHVQGFRIPTMQEVLNLGSALGSLDLVPSLLQIQYDGCSGYAPDYSSSFGAFWVYPTEQCPLYGTLCQIFDRGNHPPVVGTFHTNSDQIGGNLRLMRYMTADEWELE